MRLVVLVAGLLVLGGCAGLASLNGFATGPAGPRAAPCEVAIGGAGTPRDAFTDTRVARMTAGDGGWCGWAVRLVGQDQVSYPWERAQVVQAPAHGAVRVRPDGTLVHIEYRAAAGYRGPDAFTVRLAPGFAPRAAEVEVVPARPGAAAPETVITSTRLVVEPGGDRSRK